MKYSRLIYLILSAFISFSQIITAQYLDQILNHSCKEPQFLFKNRFFSDIGHLPDSRLPDAINRVQNSPVFRVQPERFPDRMKNYLEFQSNSHKLIPNDSVRMNWVRHYGSGLAPSSDCAGAIAIDKYGNIYVTGASHTPTTASDYLTIKYNPEGNILWTAQYNGHANGADWPTAIAVDSFCNVYVTGCSYTFGSSYNYATVKYDSNGNEQWVKQYNGPSDTVDEASAIAVDNSGNVYVTGRSMRITVLPAWDWDYATIKYNSSGDVIWEKRYNDPVGNYDDQATDIKVDHFGYAYVTGVSYGWPSKEDYLTIRYDQDGNEDLLLRYNAANSRDCPFALAVDASRNIYVTGYSASTDEGDYATIKYNSFGIQLWVARYNGPANNFDEAKAIVVDDSGNVIVTGASWGGVSSYYDITTIKYNSQGGTLWVDRYDNITHFGDFARSIAYDYAGNIIVAGSSYSGEYGPSDYVTIKYSSQGSRLWVKKYGLSGGHWDEGNAMVVDKLGNIFVTGYSEDSLYNCDYATIKYTPSGNEEWVKRYDGVGMSCDGIIETKIDSAGNVYVTGNSYSKTTRNDFLTIKYTSIGSVDWMQRFNGLANLNDVVYGMEIDHHGNVYLTGGSQNSNGDYDYVLVKYNPLGLQEWVTYYSGIGNKDDCANDIVIDSAGFIYVTGTSIEFGNNKDITTIKYNSSGDFIWVSHYDGEVSGFDLGRAITVDDIGNVYVTGASEYADTLGDYITIKYNPAGDQMWASRYDHAGDFDCPVKIVVDKSYCVYVTGTSTDPNLRDDYATVKYDPSGNQLWVRRYNNDPFNFDDKAMDLTLDNSGHLYVTGASYGEVDYFDWLTIKYDTAGNQIWTKRFDGRAYNDWPWRIISDFAGNIYVTGHAIFTPPFRTDILTIKYYPDGEIAWTAIYDDPYNSFDYALGIDVNTSGEISIGGVSGIFGHSIFTTIKYNQQEHRSVEITRGWNMISVPMKVYDYRKTTLFPTAISHAWTYQQEVGIGYVRKDTLANGIGYWLKFGIDQLIEMTGFPYPIDTINLAEGWNMVGSLSEPVDVNTIEFIPGDITRSRFFGYKNGYFVTDTIEPGRGYWVKVSQPAKMILSTNSALKSITQPKLFATDELPPPPPESEILNYQSQVPNCFALEQNFPNPFNPSTIINYQLPVKSWVTLKVYNILGQEVAILVDGIQDAGFKLVEFKADKLSSGIYYYQLRTIGIGSGSGHVFMETKKMILLQ